MGCSDVACGCPGPGAQTHTRAGTGTGNSPNNTISNSERDWCCESQANNRHSTEAQKHTHTHTYTHIHTHIHTHTHTYTHTLTHSLAFIPLPSLSMYLQTSMSAASSYLFAPTLKMRKFVSACRAKNLSTSSFMFAPVFDDSRCNGVERACEGDVGIREGGRESVCVFVCE